MISGDELGTVMFLFCFSFVGSGEVFLFFYYLSLPLTFLESIFGYILSFVLFLFFYDRTKAWRDWGGRWGPLVLVD